MEQWMAAHLQPGQEIDLTIAEGGIVKHGGKIQAVVSKVGVRTISVLVQQTIEVPLVDIERVDPRRRQRMEIEEITGGVPLHDPRDAELTPVALDRSTGGE